MDLETSKSFDGRLIHLETTVATLTVSFNKEVKEIKDMIKEISKPKDFNWIGFGSLCVAATVAFGTFTLMFLNMRLTPLETGLRTVSEAQAKTDQWVKRDLEWSYENSNLRQAHIDKLIDKMWERVFSGDPPKFNERPKTANAP